MNSSMLFAVLQAYQKWFTLSFDHFCNSVQLLSCPACKNHLHEYYTHKTTTKHFKHKVPLFNVQKIAQMVMVCHFEHEKNVQSRRKKTQRGMKSTLFTNDGTLLSPHERNYYFIRLDNI